MANPSSRPLPAHLRHPSMSGPGTAGAGGGTSGNSPALQNRINEKKSELENLRQLRDLSAQLAGQMQMLEDKFETLSNGTEAVAAVLSNWHNVLRAINMASQKIPKPKDVDGDTLNPDGEEDAPLPQTLVRIPVEQQDHQGRHP